MAASSEVMVHSSNSVGADVEALVQAAVSVLSNDMQLPSQSQLQEQVQVVMDGAPDLRQERLYMCTDCNLAFYGENGEAEWQWHLKQHQPYKCDLCDESFEQKQTLAQHMRTHSIQMPFICEQCGSAYSLKANLQQHMKVHEVAQQLKCPQCDEKFVYQSHLDRHFKSVHTGEPLKIFACDLCNKQFTQQKNLVQHQKIHQTGEKPYKCNECSASYSYKCHLTRHLIIHTGEKPYRCKFCGKAFNRNAHLVRHRKIHSEGEKQYRCEECNFAFWEKSDLQRHIRSHAGNRPFMCEFCHQTFTWKRYLLKHLNIHHRDDTHVFCQDCCNCFESEEKLEEHKIEAHSNKKQLTHTCLHCGEEFYFKYKLDEHTFQHTGIKAHKCEKCNAAFVSRKELERHVADHSMEVSFHCNTCDQNFASIQDLQTHVSLHTGRGKFQCGQCKSSFKWKSQLKAHMISHNETRAFPCTDCNKDFKRVKDLKRHQRIYHEMQPPYHCNECNIDLHSPLGYVKHEKAVHSAEALKETPRGYECTHCSGAFKLKEDLIQHMKVHQPKPYVCITCSKGFSKLKFIKKHLGLKHGIEEAFENQHYRKIVVKSEMEENGLEEGEIPGMGNVTYDGIQEATYDRSHETMYPEGQKEKYMEIRAPEPLPTTDDMQDTEMQRIEIVSMPGYENQQDSPATQIIIESVQGATQARVEPSPDITSNVTIPKVVMIRGDGPSQNQAQRNVRNNLFGQQAGSMTTPQTANRLTTENILLQLAQQAQMQKQMPVSGLQGALTSGTKLSTSVLHSIISAQSSMPTVIPSQNLVSSAKTLVAKNAVDVSTTPVISIAEGQNVTIETPTLPTVDSAQTIPAVSMANLPVLQNIIGAASEQPMDQSSGDYENVISMIPSVVNTEGEQEGDDSTGGQGDGALVEGEHTQAVQVEVIEGEPAEGEITETRDGDGF